MPISSNLVKLSDIQNEFGGINPIRLSEYYNIETSSGNITSSGLISLMNFQNKSSTFNISNGYLKDGTDNVYIFSNVGLATIHIPVSKYTYVADILVVGGGGGTGFANCGGGGGGGVVYQRNIRLDSGITYNIYVGDGGNRGYDSDDGLTTTTWSGSTGNDSYIQIGTTDLLINGITYRGYGGGIGGGRDNSGGNGGSGGGGAGGCIGGTSIQGNTYWNGSNNIPGGTNGGSGYYSGNGWTGGNGGGGFINDITGISTTYASGGQGFYWSSTLSGTTPDSFGAGAGGGGSIWTGGQKGRSGVVIFKIYRLNYIQPNSSNGYLQNGTDNVIIFSNVGLATIHIPVNNYIYIADILVVGGGGGTRFDVNNSGSGGGGGGGVVYQRNIRLNSGTTYNIYVGDGGNGENSSSSTTIYSASTGNDSYIQIGTTDLLINGITYRGYGGGIGGNGRNNGGNGGSGGGSTYGYNSGTSIQGNTYWNGTANIPGGKNGESGYYSSINGWSGGKGGGGFPCNITGINISYAMGGQGIYPSTTTSGTTPDIFGGGAGGGGSTQTGGQKGKSGVVIFKF